MELRPRALLSLLYKMADSPLLAPCDERKGTSLMGSSAAVPRLVFCSEIRPALV